MLEYKNNVYSLTEQFWFYLLSHIMFMYYVFTFALYLVFSFFNQYLPNPEESSQISSLNPESVSVKGKVHLALIFIVFVSVSIIVHVTVILDIR